MKTKKQRSIHVEKDDILRAVEQELIQAWRSGRLAAPTSPIEAASALAMRSLVFIKGAKTFPYPLHLPQPSEGEFSRMLVYIVDQYRLSPAFPYSNEQLNEQIKEDIVIKVKEIQRRRDHN